MRDDGLRLPPADQFLADTACPSCGAVSATFAWATTATVAAGDQAVTAPVGVRVEWCPECGAPLPHPA